MLVEPSVIDEVISFTPAMRPNWRSSGVATDDAMVSGLAPGKLGGYGNRREIDLRKRRFGEEIVGDGAGNPQRHGQQSGGDRPVNKRR